MALVSESWVYMIVDICIALGQEMHSFGCLYILHSKDIERAFKDDFGPLP